MSPEAPPPRHGVAADPSTWPTGRLLSAAARRMERAWDAYLGEWQLNHASVSALAVLTAGPRSQRALASALGVTEQTTSRIVAGLERSGYVTRGTHPADRRQRLISATESGMSALGALDQTGAVDRLVDHGLSADEEATLRALLTRFL